MKNQDFQSMERNHYLNSTHRLSSTAHYSRRLPQNACSQQLITQIAKTRLLEDQLISQKFKSEALERKGMEYIEIIENLQYTIADLKEQLIRAQHQIQLQMDRDKQLMEYEINLKEVGVEIAELNEILNKKNKQCQGLIQLHSKIKQEKAELLETMNAIKQKRSEEKERLSLILKTLEIDVEPSFSEELKSEINKIEQGILELKENLSKTKNALEKCRKQNSDSMMKQKEQIIALEYALKLAQTRNTDLEKKKTLESSFAIDRKIENVIEEMLKKQDELTLQIEDLQAQNQDLRQQMQMQKLARSHHDTIKANDMQKQLRETKKILQQTMEQNRKLQAKMKKYSLMSEMQASRSMSEGIEISKKYRETSEENKRLRLQIIELESDKKMLQKELKLRETQKQ